MVRIVGGGVQDGVMGAVSRLDEQQRILRFWWMLELFSPQPVPKPTSAAAVGSDQRVIEWPGKGRDARLPWERLEPPKLRDGKRWVWEHTLYLGVYQLEDTYEILHQFFHDDRDAYDERPGGTSACAGVLVDQDGRIAVGSAVLSSALWAVSRIRSLGPRNLGWADGFSAAQDAFVKMLDAHEVERAEDAAEQSALDADSMYALTRLAHASAGIDGVENLATQRVIIKSVMVPADRPDDEIDMDFLNSFFLEDLNLVRSRISDDGGGSALNMYLTGDASLDVARRVDVIKVPSVVDASVSIDRLPLGRWPSDPEHTLALSQQFAVNHALKDLAGAGGLMGVNGPPGTGKTTMLRDILAGNVVERARRLSSLRRPDDAFVSGQHRWNQGGYLREVPELRADLTGFEMVVASANNAAVDNVTVEIPSTAAIDSRWPGGVDYFADIATEVLRAGGSAPVSGEGEPLRAWGLVAARLGNKRNRSNFRRRFWFDTTDKADDSAAGRTPGMYATLETWVGKEGERTNWADARSAFAKAEAKVQALIDERHQAQQRRRQLMEAVAHENQLLGWLDQLNGTYRRLEDELASHQLGEVSLRAECERAAGRYERHRESKSGVIEAVLTFGRARIEWREKSVALSDILSRSEGSYKKSVADGLLLRDQINGSMAAISGVESDLAHTRKVRTQISADCDGDRQRFGAAYPDESGGGDQRELRAPWLDSELDAARSELFLAALQLHRDFLTCTAEKMRDWLRAATEVVAGIVPHDLSPEKRVAAWRLFFLVVPMVSTTFASLGRMFGDIGQESIGWLLIDEAGQASPQYAVGGIWRARRVVAVGDPLQLQPVVTIPRKVQRDIAATYGVLPTWIPPQASVQTLADRVSVYGTTLPQGDADMWVSAPLRVHRRCDDPMFSLCNEIAYDGIMVNGVIRRLDDPGNPDLFDGSMGPLIATSRWIHLPARTPGTHLQKEEIVRLKMILDDLIYRSLIPASKIIVISPFRAIADALRAMAPSYPGLRAGTIHTAQGREAPVVILLLGGDPAKPGAKAWASGSVNLVNVAVSRAQRRLYVIGDRHAGKSATISPNSRSHCVRISGVAGE
ncbi:MAG: AAA domain-containing protein [Propioniciclava sp.]|uniref:DEAD/DEAH box helicase n=1 Tax=Propioniciclava sp. TaxID=2038686 RepID=UPI0039E37059